MPAMPALTVITPIAPHHLPLFEECAASVARQTIAVQHLTMIDESGRGPAYIRNALLRQVTTEYVTFLDADDWLEPTFAEETLQAVRPARYVYTDWYQDGNPIAAPECAWTNATAHLVTAVIPTAWARAVGGFDEGLSGMEDTDFYVKLATRNFCGKRLARPLLHYRRDGGRAKRIHESGEVEALQVEMRRRYGGFRVSCCGDENQESSLPLGERRPGDVLAMAMWGGNREQMGLATGRRYPRTGNRKREWVDPRDVEFSPHLWREVPQESLAPKANAPQSTGRPRGLQGLHAVLASAGKVREPSPAEVAVQEAAQTPVVAVTPIPNIRKVIRLARAAYGEVDVAIAVKPRKFYPSHVDFWRLFELAGFEVRYEDEIDLSDARQTYIFSSPERIVDCSHAKARTIFWSLEYTGDYASTENAQTVSEVWSSDPAHAARTGAKCVLMGSHPHLNPDLKGLEPNTDLVYDATMLGYMVGRRGAIKERLSAYRWPQNYPGYDSAERHNLLRRTRLMLHIHQHDQPAMAPLRYAIAAAYRMPVISEGVPDAGLYSRAIIWSDYDAIPARVRQFLDGKIEDDAQYATKLHQLLCVERPFRVNVIEALGTAQSATLGKVAKAA